MELILIRFVSPVAKCERTETTNKLHNFFSFFSHTTNGFVFLARAKTLVTDARNANRLMNVVYRF